MLFGNKSLSDSRNFCKVVIHLDQNYGCSNRVFPPMCLTLMLRLVLLHHRSYIRATITISLDFTEHRSYLSFDPTKERGGVLSENSENVFDH